jgi:hypothetical protein
MQQRCRPVSSNSALDVDVSQTLPLKALCMIQSGQGPFRGFHAAAGRCGQGLPLRVNITPGCATNISLQLARSTHMVPTKRETILLLQQPVRPSRIASWYRYRPRTHRCLKGSVNTYPKVSTGNRVIQALQRATFRTWQT